MKQLFAVFVFLLSGTVSMGAELHQQDWFKSTLGGVTVYSNIDERTARSQASGLYALSEYASLVPGVTVARLSRPVDLIYVDSKSDMKALGHTSVTITSWRSGFDRHVILARNWPQFNETAYILGRIAHILVHNTPAYSDIRWVREGLATYLSGLSWNSEALMFGVSPRHIAGGSSDYRLRKPENILVESAYDQLSRRDRAGFKPQAWILVHYLLSRDPVNQSFATLVKTFRSLVAEGKSELYAFQVASGVDTDDLPDILRKYRMNCCSAFQVPPSQVFADGWPKAEKVETAEIALVLAREAVRNDKLEAAGTWLSMASEHEQFRTEAFLLLAELNIKSDDPVAALHYIQRAARESPSDLRTKIRLGRYWIQRAEIAEDAATRDEHLARAKSALLDAWKLDNANAEIYYLNGLRYLLEGVDIELAINMLEEAAFLQPDNLSVLEVLGQAYLRSGDPEEARRIAK
ncbi:MAG: hypothetical protein AAGA44_16855, partial [Pseudomonadota bacterium]